MFKKFRTQPRMRFGALSFAFILATTTLVMNPAEAVQRTHVSAAFGSDNNTATSCTAPAPCRFFQAAMSVTDTNGEVVVLDSGGYGAVTITKSVALTSPTGVYAGISVFPGASGVTIATAGVNAVLRGLTINGQGGDSGIKMTAGNKLTVENCVISNLKGHGIFVDTPATVRITDTAIRDTVGADITVGIGIAIQNGAKATVTRTIVSGSSGTGVFVNGTAVNARTTADIAGSTFDGNYNGVYVYTALPNAYTTASVSDSVAVQNRNWGFIAQNASARSGFVALFANNNKLSNNGNGIAGYGLSTRVDTVGNTISFDLFSSQADITYALYEDGVAFFSSFNNALLGTSVITGGVYKKVLF